MDRALGLWMILFFVVGCEKETDFHGWPSDAKVLGSDPDLSTILVFDAGGMADVQPAFDVKVGTDDGGVADVQYADLMEPKDAGTTIVDASRLPSDAQKEVGDAQGCSPAGSGNVTTFADGKALGLLRGPTYVEWGRDDSVIDPVCSPGTYLSTTHGHDCSGGLKWKSISELCVSGSVPATPEDQMTYSWGISFGAMVDSCGGALGRSYTSVSVVAAGVPASAIAGKLWSMVVGVLNQDGSTTSYYAPDDGKSKTIQLSSFNTAWWDPSGGSYLRADQVPSITSFGVIVDVSSKTSTSFTDLCLISVSFQ